MPWPVSAMVMRIPGDLWMLGGVIGGVVGANEEASALAHGVDGVGDEVVEDLANVVFKAEDGSVGGVGGLDLDAGVGEAALVEVEDGVDEFGGADLGGVDGLTMEAEGLGGDLTDAGELALCDLDVVAEAFGEGRWTGR